jgi:Cof subfamily protein (haloacid dehalogenase superfamily)
MLPFAEALGADPATVSCNGAHVVDAQGNEILARQVDPGVLDATLDYAVPRGLHVNAYTRDELLFLTRSPWADAYARRVKTLRPRYADRDEAIQMPLLKVSLVDDARAIPEHIERLVPTLDPEAARPTESEPEYLELMHPLANKGDGLSRLADRLGVGAEETAAIGDYFNDLEMLAWAGIAGAVGSGAEAVKLAADVITPSNDEGAVSWFIDWLLENGRQ